MTVAVTVIVSSRSAKRLGTFGRLLRELMPVMEGGALVDAAGAVNVYAFGSDAARPLTVTMTSAAPAACWPVWAVIVVGFVTCTLVAATPPMVTVAPAAKLRPTIVTAVPPSVVPLGGAIEVTAGAVSPGVGPFGPLSPHEPSATAAQTAMS